MKDSIFKSDKYGSSKKLREAEQLNVKAGRRGHIRTTALENEIYTHPQRVSEKRYLKKK